MRKFLAKKIEDRSVSWLRRYNIRRRLWRAFIFTTIIPLLLLGMFCAFLYQKDMNEKLTDTFNQVLSGLGKTTDEIMEKYLNYSYPIITGDTVNKLLMEETVSEKDMVEDPLLKDGGMTAYFWMEGCDNIVIYDRFIEEVRNMNGLRPESTALNDIIGRLDGSDRNHGWFYLKNEIGENSLAFVKKIYSNEEKGMKIGYIVFLFNEKRVFRNVYKEVEAGENSDIFIVDKEGTYMSSKNEKQKIGGNISDDMEGVDLASWGECGNFTRKYDGEKSLIIYQYNQKMDAWLVMKVESAYIDHGMERMFLLTVSVILCIILLCVVVVYMINASITSPILNLLEFAGKVSKGDYKQEIVDGSNDEMGRLTRYLNSMVRKMVCYMDKIELDEKEKRKLEIQNLQYQIQPHFLFNTLNTFKYIAVINNVESLGDGIEALCNLLKNTVNIRDEMIPLKDEIENIRNYICIQEFRYAGCINIFYYIDEQAEKVCVPRLLLQPLVENSIVHGMKEDVILSIEIKAVINDGAVDITVEDNGMGFIPADMTKKKQRFSGIGIENIRERIRLVYQGEGDIEINSEPQRGTKIKISLPVRRDENV